MKESHGEDLASHSGLEPYAVDGDVLGVALVRGTGRPAIELRNLRFACRPRNGDGKATCNWALMASLGVTRRSRRTCACLETPNARTGRSQQLPVCFADGNGQRTSRMVMLI